MALLACVPQSRRFIWPQAGVVESSPSRRVPVGAAQARGRGSVSVSRRQMLLVSSIFLLQKVPTSQAEEEDDEEDLEEPDEADEWEEFRGQGFLLKIPPGFEDTIPPDEYAPGETPLYGERPKEKPYAALFISPNKEEFVSVVVRKTSQLKPTFFTAKSITDLGNVKEVSKLLLPVGARLTGLSSVTMETQVPRVHYLYEYQVAENHVFVSTAASNGRIFIAAATAPETMWKKDGPVLSLSAASLALK